MQYICLIKPIGPVAALLLSASAGLAEDPSPYGALRFAAVGAAPRAAAIAAARAIPSDALCPSSPLNEAALHALVAAEAARQGVDAKLAAIVLEQESAAGRDLNSPAGARGPMQLKPATAARYGVADICDPAENIRGGVAHLKNLSAEFGGSVFLILAAYNAGAARVREAKGVPAIAETVRYVASGANSYFGLGKNLADGRGAMLKRAAKETGARAPAPDAPTPAAGPTWIGGSVLYLGDASQ